jgi:hypothetical protein
VAGKLAAHGVYFYALVMVVMPDGSVRLARVVTEPPWWWYAAHADEVHGNLHDWLEAVG